MNHLLILNVMPSKITMSEPNDLGRKPISYNGKVFRSIENTSNGEVSGDTIFHYFQSENILSASYAGGSIRQGSIIGIVNSDGSLDFSYQHVNNKGEICTGRCHSIPNILADGRIQLQEDWQWTSGDCSSGRSIVQEVTIEE